jgi:hypothetical protein
MDRGGRTAEIIALLARIDIALRRDWLDNAYLMADQRTMIFDVMSQHRL